MGGVRGELPVPVVARRRRTVAEALHERCSRAPEHAARLTSSGGRSRAPVAAAATRLRYALASQRAPIHTRARLGLRRAGQGRCHRASSDGRVVCGRSCGAGTPTTSPTRPRLVARRRRSITDWRVRASEGPPVRCSSDEPRRSGAAAVTLGDGRTLALLVSTLRSRRALRRPSGRAERRHGSTERWLELSATWSPRTRSGPEPWVVRVVALSTWRQAGARRDRR